MKKLLVSLLTLISVHAFGTGNVDTALSESAQASFPSLSSSHYYGGSSGSRVHFMMDVFLGDFIAHITEPGVKGTGNFSYGGELGVSIGLSSPNANGTTLLHISAFANSFGLKEKYTDGLGNPQSYDWTVVTYGVPVSISRMGGGDQTTFFWEASAYFTFLDQVKNGDVASTSHFTGFYVVPSIAAGLSIPFQMVNRRSGSSMGEGKVLIGPFFSYVGTNLSRDNGTTITGSTIGVMWRYVFM